MLLQQGGNTQPAPALSPSSIVVGIKIWEHLWDLPPLSGKGKEFPSAFPGCIPDPRVNTAGAAASAPQGHVQLCPLAPVLFGLAAGEKQRFPDTLSAGCNSQGTCRAWKTALWAGRSPWECSGPKVGPKQTQPWSSCSAGTAGMGQEQAGQEQELVIYVLQVIYNCWSSRRS